MGESSHETGESSVYVRWTDSPWIAGMLGGVTGAIIFGVLMWVIEPDVLTASIPALYGVSPTTFGGWLIHLGHGVVLGLIFAAIAERPLIRSYIEDDVETQALQFVSVRARLAGLGFVFGLAIWAILPLLVMPIWFGMVGAPDAPAMTDVAIASLFGHLLYGVLLGTVYGIIVESG